MPTTKTRRRRRPTEAQKARSAASKAVANEALHAYAVTCLSDPAEMEYFREMAASVGWKADPAEPGPGYSLLNVMLLAAQRRPIVHCGGYEYWLTQGSVVARGEKALATFRALKRAGDVEEIADDEQAPGKRRPRYFVKRGTFDVTQTAPREKCPHCGTAPTGCDDTTTRCPDTCAVFALRPGLKPPLALVNALMADQLMDDADEDDADA
ncbi:hypothetical protein ACFMQL_20145 [Nonomuraea fastidiosa]|uniref:hypothetical protein n=1 Tax=Nonomuraea fastidiosa TaxID=46173 RepID=UPI00366F1D17